jgi:hypothetical protein
MKLEKSLDGDWGIQLHEKYKHNDDISVISCEGHHLLTSRRRAFTWNVKVITLIFSSGSWISLYLKHLIITTNIGTNLLWWLIWILLFSLTQLRVQHPLINLGPYGCGYRLNGIQVVPPVAGCSKAKYLLTLAMCPDAPYFTILFIRRRVLPLNWLIRLSAHAFC